MKITSLISSALFAALLAASTPVLARSLAGVEVAETVTLDGKALKLNGAGIRKKVFIKVYVGALYLESAQKSAADIIKSDSVRMVRMVFLRDVGKDKIVGAYKEGFEKNSPDKAAMLQPSLDKLTAALTDAKSGTVMTVTYVPGKGTTVAMQGGPSVVIEGKDFADAMLRNWLGDKPADGSLKTELLAGG